MRRALGRMNQDKEIFVSLFGTIPAKPEFFLRWLNGQLRYLVGFALKKENRNRAFSLRVCFCAPWKISENFVVENKHFIPEISFSGLL
ncbi:putative origin of replication-binding protein [Marseillevirus Shanghai 1]|nr:putative origin of replication-binding protein [Marseillevirus Shanghai 1]